MRCQSLIKVILTVAIALGACAWIPRGWAGEGSSASADEGLELEEFQEPPSSYQVIIDILGQTGASLPMEGRVAVPPLPFGDRLSLSAEQLLRDSGSAGWLGKLRSPGQVDPSQKSNAAASADSQSQKTASSSAVTVSPSAVSVKGLAWRSTDCIYSYSNLGSMTKNYTFPLSYGSAWGNAVYIPGNSLASTYCNIAFDKNSYVKFNTFANPSTAYNDARATMWTTTNPTSYTYIYVSVLPTSSSDYGKPVAITLTGSSDRTLSRQDNKSYNSFSIYSGNSLWASHISYGSGTTKYTFPARTYNTTVGTSVPVAMQSTSYAVKGTSAQQSIVFYVTVR